MTSTVLFGDGLYKYEYTWSEPDKQIAPIILALCLGITADQVAQVLDGVYANYAGFLEIDTYSGSDPSNPGLIGSLYGLQMNFNNAPNTRRSD